MPYLTLDLNSQDFEVVIYAPKELNHSSYVHTGLFELEKTGQIGCKVKVDFRKRLGRVDVSSGEVVISNHDQPKTSFYQLVDRRSKRRINFAIDLYDVSWFFSEVAISECEFVFKRNFVRKHVEIASQHGTAKILPLGLSFPVYTQSRRGNFKFFIGLIMSNLLVSIKLDRKIVSRILDSLRSALVQWEFAKNGRNLEEFKIRSVEKKNQVIFQTRCFPSKEDSDASTLHEQRAALIRRLRSLGGSFVGGFVKDDVADRKYADCITNLPTGRMAYMNLVRHSSIGVYTRGLAFSPAWKLSEYFSQGVCVVGEPLTCELPIPLRDGVHWIVFTDHEDCIEKCERLLVDDVRRNQIASNALNYYLNHIDPCINVKRILQIMISDGFTSKL